MTREESGYACREANNNKLTERQKLAPRTAPPLACRTRTTEEPGHLGAEPDQNVYLQISARYGGKLVPLLLEKIK